MRILRTVRVAATVIRPHHKQSIRQTTHEQSRLLGSLLDAAGRPNRPVTTSNPSEKRPRDHKQPQIACVSNHADPGAHHGLILPPFPVGSARLESEIAQKNRSEKGLETTGSRRWPIHERLGAERAVGRHRGLGRAA